MNLFHDYQRKIFVSLKKLEIKKKIKIPHEIKKFATELPPKEQNADISCNAAMVLANANNSSPLKLAEIFKNHLLLDIKEFKNIVVANPGFLNITFHNDFWKSYLLRTIKLNKKYGSNNLKRHKWLVLNQEQNQ